MHYFLSSHRWINTCFCLVNIVYEFYQYTLSKRHFPVDVKIIIILPNDPRALLIFVINYFGWHFHLIKTMRWLLWCHSRMRLRIVCKSDMPQVLSLFGMLMLCKYSIIVLHKGEIIMVHLTRALGSNLSMSSHHYIDQSGGSSSCTYMGTSFSNYYSKMKLWIGYGPGGRFYLGRVAYINPSPHQHCILRKLIHW